MSVPKMTPMQRVMAAIAGKRVDVAPAITPTSVAIFESMRQSGAFYPSAHTNAEEMAELAAMGYELFGFDSVAPYFSVHLEAAGLGAEVDWGDGNNTPRVVNRLFRKPGDCSLPTSFLGRPPFQALITACRLLKKRYGNRVPVIGKVVGPWTLAYNLYGVENLILDTILEPAKTSRLIQTLARVPMEFAKAQFNAGADIITWAEHVTSDLVSPQIYREFVMPVHTMAAVELQKHGPIILHVCGNVMDRVEDIARTGFKVFHMDSRNNIAGALAIVKNRILFTGCLNNPVTLAQGSPTQVRMAVEENLREGIRLVSPECALPCNVPGDNLRELVEATRRGVIPPEK